MHAKLNPWTIDRIIAVAVFACALAVYLRTLCPTLYWGDCGELATAAYNLGIAHPTGYPLWCLLAKLWTIIIPHGTTIWRLNTMSAFFGALAALCIFGFLRIIGLSRPVAVCSAGMAAFSFTLWQQCLFCETYSLTAFYTSLLMLLTARWRTHTSPQPSPWKGEGARNPSPPTPFPSRERGVGRERDLMGIAVACGFAMTNHQTNTLFIPGILGFVLWSEPRLRNVGDPAVRRVWLRCVGAWALPLLFYLYIPIRAMARPPMSWGYPKTPFDVIYHITGRNYAGLMFHTPWTEARSSLMQWALGLGRELHWGFVAFAAVGIVALLVGRTRTGGGQGRRPLAFLLLWVIAADVVYTVNYGIYNRYIYYIPSYIAISALSGIGLQASWDWLKRGVEARKQPGFGTLAAACVLCFPVFQAARHWRFDDLSHNWTCYDYACNLLATMPRGSLLIDNGMDTSAFTIGYLQTVEHYRTDVTVVRRGILAGLYNPHYGRFVNNWYLRDLMAMDPEFTRVFLHRPLSAAGCVAEEPLRVIVADAAATGRPTFAVDPEHSPPIDLGDGKLETVGDYMASQGDLVQIGLLARLYGHGRRPSDAALLTETKRVWASYSTRGVYDGLYLHDDFLTDMALEYAEGELTRGRLALREGDVATAETAYGDVLHLFVSDEAKRGLQQCAAMRAGQSASSAVRG